MVSPEWAYSLSEWNLPFDHLRCTILANNERVHSMGLWEHRNKDIYLNKRTHAKEHLAIRRIFSLVDMITNTKFSNCPNVFEIGVVWQ